MRQVYYILLTNQQLFDIILFMTGILLIHKPAGMTSFQVVSQVRRTFQERKAGHSGTLDPNATGLMIVALGKYTKLLPYIVCNEKKYVATFSLGKRFDTQDVWGKVIEEKPFQKHTQQQLDELANLFLGHIQQVPPMYSAIKKDGKKLYEYARKGIEVERKARDAYISALHVKQLDENVYQMEATVSSGTYIRTLIEDYCASMGEFGYMTSLVREAIEHVSLHEACTLDALNKAKCIDPSFVLQKKWKQIQCENIQDVKNGKVISIHTQENHVILMDGKEILAAYQRREDGLFQCVRGLF